MAKLYEINWWEKNLVGKFKNLLVFELLIFTLVFLIFRILPINFFLEHDFELCLFKRLFKHECLGCGTIRALSQLAHGNWQQAWKFNQLVPFELLGIVIFNFYLWQKEKNANKTEN